jgi:hypothetical protein
MLPAGIAQALSFTLDIEFDNGLTGDFATVDVTEEGRGLLFEIDVLEGLGDGADLHRFYFNLADDVPDLILDSDDDVMTEYVLSVGPPVAGGAGSSFGYGVSFGNGAGGRGNGELKDASFTITPEDSALSLSIADFLYSGGGSAASGGSIPIDAAAHIQGTSMVSGATSETVGGIVPEPSTGLLLAAGLTLGAVVRGRAAR